MSTNATVLEVSQATPTDQNIISYGISLAFSIIYYILCLLLALAGLMAEGFAGYAVLYRTTNGSWPSWRDELHEAPPAYAEPGESSDADTAATPRSVPPGPRASDVSLTGFLGFLSVMNTGLCALATIPLVMLSAFRREAEGEHVEGVRFRDVGFALLVDCVIMTMLVAIEVACIQLHAFLREGGRGRRQGGRDVGLEELRK